MPSKTNSDQPIETTILVDYEIVDGWHVFTSQMVRGLYVANPDQRAAYEAVCRTIEILLFENENINVVCRPALTFETFLERLRSRMDMSPIRPGIPQPFMVSATP